MKFTDSTSTKGWNPVVELVISRITGIKYPLESVEAMMFRDYFDVDRRDIDINDGLLSISDGYDYRKSNQHWSLNHRILIPYWYPYAVLSLTLQGGDVIETIDLEGLCGVSSSYSISKYNTKVIMQGSVSRLVHYNIDRSHITQAISDTCSQLFDDLNAASSSPDGKSTSTSKPFAFIIPSITVVGSDNGLRHTLVTVEDASTASNNQQLTNLISNGISESMLLLDGIHRMFRLSSSGLDPMIQLEVMKEPALMIHDDNAFPNGKLHTILIYS